MPKTNNDQSPQLLNLCCVPHTTLMPSGPPYLIFTVTPRLGFCYHRHFRDETRGVGNLPAVGQPGVGKSHSTGFFPGQPGRLRPLLVCVVWTTQQPHHGERRRREGRPLSLYSFFMSESSTRALYGDRHDTTQQQKENAIFLPPFSTEDSRATAGPAHSEPFITINC